MKVKSLVSLDFLKSQLVINTQTYGCFRSYEAIFACFVEFAHCFLSLIRVGRLICSDCQERTPSVSLTLSMRKMLFSNRKQMVLTVVWKQNCSSLSECFENRTIRKQFSMTSHRCSHRFWMGMSVWRFITILTVLKSFSTAKQIQTTLQCLAQFLRTHFLGLLKKVFRYYLAPF